jgi:hypothetical protein
MKKNLFIAALAFVAMGANAQVVNTLDGYQAGAQFVQDGITYEVVEVTPATVKVVDAAETSVIVQEQFSINDTYTVVDFSAGLANKDLEKVTAAADEPITLPGEAFFSAASYEEGNLVVPEASITKYAKADVWKKFLKKWTESGKLLGDVDGNGKISNNDYAKLLEIYLEDDEDLYNPMFDMDGNGKITNNDVAKVLELYLADLDYDL